MKPTYLSNADLCDGLCQRLCLVDEVIAIGQLRSQHCSSIASYNLLCLFQQLLNLKSTITLTELLQQLLPPCLVIPAVKPLQAHQQPLTLIHCNTSSINHTPLQQHQPLRLSQIQMMRDRRMWLGILASQLELSQVREENTRCSRRWEGPLEEVYFCALPLSW